MKLIRTIFPIRRQRWRPIMTVMSLFLPIWLSCSSISFAAPSQVTTSPQTPFNPAATQLSVPLIATPTDTPPTAFLAMAVGNAVTDPIAILRDALPIDNSYIRKVETDLEAIPQQIRGKQWGAINKSLNQAILTVGIRREQLLNSVTGDRQTANGLLDKMESNLSALQGAVKAQDKAEIETIRRKILAQITDLEELMVGDFPFDIPEEYADLPQLKGRARVQLETSKGDLILVIDGYNAPINGGNFVDLVQRGFYDGLSFTDLEDNFVVQTGDPPGPDAGFIDPNTGEYRAIPIEIMVEGDEEPVYGLTLEDVGRYLDKPVLPFNAYGAVALGRPEFDPNGGSSQFFFFKFDNELTPPGFNLMDGRYSVFGYLVEGKSVLEKLTPKDTLIKATVLDGLDNLVEPPGYQATVPEPEVPQSSVDDAEAFTEAEPEAETLDMAESDEVEPVAAMTVN